MVTKNEKSLQTKHAVIHTATISIKTLRIDKHQVTQSVFRQLPEESIFSSNGTLRGEPWGRVNYTWGSNPFGTGFHVVWQDGDELKRYPMRTEYPEEIIGQYLWSDQDELIEDDEVEYLGAVSYLECEDALNQLDDYEDNTGQKLHLSLCDEDRRLADLLAEEGYGRQEIFGGFLCRSTKESFIQRLRKRITQLHDENEAADEEAKKEGQVTMKAFAASVARIRDSDQLFIAT